MRTPPLGSVVSSVFLLSYPQRLKIEGSVSASPKIKVFLWWMFGSRGTEREIKQEWVFRISSRSGAVLSNVALPVMAGRGRQQLSRVYLFYPHLLWFLSPTPATHQFRSENVFPLYLSQTTEKRRKLFLLALSLSKIKKSLEPSLHGCLYLIIIPVLLN